jgi:hypothetical protein
MKINLSVLAGVAAAAFVGSASAAPIVTVGGTALAGEGQVSSVAGVTNINFNVANVYPSGIAVTGAATNFPTASIPGAAAQPPADTTRYLALSPALGQTVTISIAGGANYIGFYASSLDSFNVITLNTDTGPIVYTGTELAGFAGVPAGGDQSIGRYFNVFETGNAFNSVTLSSSGVAFELDNFAIGRAAPPGAVPLPGTVALIGLGMLAFGSTRRSKK